MEFDVIIIGAGPAGAVAALKADPSLSVLLIEKRCLLDPCEALKNEKSCGGMLDPSAQKALAHLGIAIPKEVMQDPEVFGVKAVDFESHLERFYQRNYLNISRPLFDAMMLQKAARRPNVTVWEKSQLIKIREEKEAVIAIVRKDDVVTEVRGKTLVGADGASSFVRHYLAKKPSRLKDPKVYVSIQEWHKVEEPLPYYMAIFDHRVTDFYGWVIPKGKEILIGAAMPKGPMLQTRFDRFKQDLTIKGFDLSSPTKRNGAFILRPRPLESVYTGRGKVLLVGEAAGLISPSSSEGISFALRSGELLAKAGFEQKAYEKSLWKLRLSIFLKSLKAPLMYTPWLRKMIFLSRLTHVEMTESVKTYQKERWE